MMPDVAPVALPPQPSPETIAAHEDSTRKWRRFQRAKYWAIGLGTALIVVLIITVVIMVAVLLGLVKRVDNQTTLLVALGKANKDNTTATKQAVGILLDCTTPGHACYEQGQQSTRTAVQALNDAANARELCAHDLSNDTVDKLTACVIATLKNGHP